MENWTLHRIGYDEPVFALQNHVPIIRIGRANEVHKQCLGKNTYYYLPKILIFVKVDI